MKVKPRATVACATAAAWRRWLEVHHQKRTEVWLVFSKRHTGRASVSYDEAVCEALCFGWVDSLIRRLDEDRYARKFTPRRPNSRWSTSNRQRYERMRQAAKLAARGEALAPTARSGDAPRVSPAAVSAMQGALKTNAAAARTFRTLPPSHQRRYILWISSAKRADTKARRLTQALAMLAKGQRLEPI